MYRESEGGEAKRGRDRSSEEISGRKGGEKLEKWKNERTYGGNLSS